MKKNGTTTSGTTRWRCSMCNASTSLKIDNRAKTMKRFLEWLLHPYPLSRLPGAGRTFRRQTAWCWDYWPAAPLCPVYTEVVHVDGIYLGRKAVVLIAAAAGQKVLAWHVARRECASSWQALLRKLQRPSIVVCDGGSGFAKACKELWPTTKIQRCTFHVFTNIRAQTTLHPRTAAGREILNLGRKLLTVRTENDRDEWIDQYLSWCARYKEFLAETTRLENGQIVPTHARLLKVRNLLNNLLAKGHIFTYLTPEAYPDGKIPKVEDLLPATNNLIEGSINSPLRELLHAHRGMSLLHRLTTICWWCYRHSYNPQDIPTILSTIWTHDEILKANQKAANPTPDPDYNSLIGGPIFGTYPLYKELHHTYHYER
ncbi:hypothetical protein BK816_07295 [Boudabousia tangfeifanii]|uniref:MULE transposase domain-containing protein n=2 Tax=Boudabousia tangfeifanii TaxID=1912795 RepID=A0A1D9MKS7_9ACTO|nr:IS1249 family transposase [Boudabousia tangfeifanii]AOZ71875.1 hypothetical protein BK816_00050 [Boudabousia tangfeifanii]AOZ72789.1 hypothetical protein BK816_05345 [Boudabousia tangfeifanii]AOZ72951.1 hypothetical protein BK816_06315 [Boudabousia tangfeifanii]AOZ73120.1 hypothetical protein BK816_07295 [Boudabousia tangfeifanii]